MKKSIIFITTAALSLTASAVPAKKAYIPYTQPDGTIISVMPVGDEFGHYYVSTDGVAMLADSNGTLKYVKTADNGALALSDMPAASEGKRTQAAREFIAGSDIQKVAKAVADNANRRREAMKRTPAATSASRAAEDIEESILPQSGLGLFTGNYPRTGKVRSLVFLVEYLDIKFRTPNPKEYFSAQLNEEGFSQYNASGSARDYFLEQSSGLFDPQFDVYGPITLPHQMSYYGGNDGWGNDLRPEQMVTHAAQLLADEIDFSEYDYDNDGKVDNIYVIYAGLGENAGGSSSSVWPHSYEIPNGPTYNGKRLFGYACSNEISDGIPDGIGTFCHEYSHVLGLPDLYSTNYSHTSSPQEWDIMDHGSYNNDSRTPPNYSSYERNALRWMSPTLVSGPESVVLESLGESNTAYLVPTSRNTEFFLLENRQRRGWDAHLPGHGLLIWHIDFRQSVWDNNAVNNTASHQYVDIVEASGRTGYSSWDYAGYSFPGNTHNTSFTGTTTPAFKDWNGNVIDYPITSIKEDIDGLVTFDIAGGAIYVPTPEAPSLTATDRGAIEIAWTAVEGATGYDISVATLNADGTEMPVDNLCDLPVGNVTSYTAEGLAGETTYTVAIRATIDRSRSPYSLASTVELPALDFMYTAPKAVSCTYSGSTVLLQWEALRGAVSYLVTAEKETPGGDETTTVDFGGANDNSLTIPDGWQWTGSANDCYTASSSGFFGDEAPAAKFSESGTSLYSPTFDGDIKEIRYWFRGASASFKSTFEIYGAPADEDKWVELSTLDNLNKYNAKASMLSVVPQEGVRRIRMTYVSAGGSVALDDVKVITPGRIFESLADEADAGNALSYTLNLPDDATGMRFWVVGVDEQGRRSKISNIVDKMVETGVNDIETSAPSFTVCDRTVVYNGTGNIAVYTLSGSTVAAAPGNSTIELPAAGIYIVATPAGACKVIVK